MDSRARKIEKHGEFIRNLKRKGEKSAICGLKTAKVVISELQKHFRSYSNRCLALQSVAKNFKKGSFYFRSVSEAIQKVVFVDLLFRRLMYWLKKDKVLEWL